MRSACLVALLSACIVATPATAQTAASASCTYDTCALRLERTRILRGAGGAEVGRLRTWGGPRLASLVVSSDSAQAYARVFDANYNSGSWILLGALVLAAPIVVDYFDDGARSLSTGWTVGLAVPSIILSIWGGGRHNRAYDALSRAVWWHNRDLPR